MKKESKEMLKTIISNQELIMKALKIEIPVKEANKAEVNKIPSKKSVAKVIAKKAVKKIAKK
ncbi:MAG: hypothetical protein V4677_09245 [Bacteroidota bacterium]